MLRELHERRRKLQKRHKGQPKKRLNGSVKSSLNKSTKKGLRRIERGKLLKKRSVGRKLRKELMRLHLVMREVVLLRRNPKINLKASLRSLKVRRNPKINLKAILRNLKVKRNPEKRTNQMVRRKT